MDYSVYRNSFFATIVLLLLFRIPAANGQLHIGFNGGLNQSVLSGSEEKINGEGESLSSTSGFHIGMRIQYDLRDWLTLGGGIGYTQRGVQRDYSGPSYFLFQTTDGRREFYDGERQQQMTVTSDHLDLPLFIQFNPVKRIQFYTGPYFSFTMSAKAGGRVRFNEESFQGETPQMETGLEFSYYGDDAGFTVDMEDEQIMMGGDRVLIPDLLGAYYEREQVDEKLYKRWHYGIHAGVNAFISSGLYLNFEWMYGLNDMTRQAADISWANRENGDFVFRDDFDRFITYRFSVGFAF